MFFQADDGGNAPRVFMERDGVTSELHHVALETDEETSVTNIQGVIYDQSCSYDKLFDAPFDVCEHPYLAGTHPKLTAHASVRYTGSGWDIKNWVAKRQAEMDAGNDVAPYDPDAAMDRIEYALTHVPKDVFAEEVEPAILKRYNPAQATELVLHMNENNAASCFVLMRRFYRASTPESKLSIRFHIYETSNTVLAIVKGFHLTVTKIDPLVTTQSDIVRSFACTLHYPKDEPVQNNNSSEIGMNILGTIRALAPKLESLHLARVHLDALGTNIRNVVLLTQMVQDGLKKLVFSEMEPNNLLVSHLAMLIREHSIETFIFTDCGSNAPVLLPILEACVENTGLSHIVLSGNHAALAHKGTTELLALLIESRKQGAHIDLRGNKFGMARCKPLVDAFDRSLASQLLLNDNRCGKVLFHRLASIAKTKIARE